MSERLKIKIVTAPNAAEDVEKLELSFIAGGNGQWCSLSGKEFGSFLKKLNMQPPCDSAVALLGFCPKEIDLHSHKNLNRNVYSSFILNSPKLETTWVSFSRWIDRLQSIHTMEHSSAMKRNRNVDAAVVHHLGESSEQSHSPEFTSCMVPLT